ncbi:MAG: AraC family transcriptional regulator [Phaeodactylibacter sp.]|nr:AraC family transcriptional regulator [Phaeodactylibacter sp.]MCB9266788.1 AraC family transcriptional regulator [Lewinellaceae bacterium]MCB9287678.1 AraC family transcriptional regulator [Lewinellaceae bacterium]
MRLFFMVNGHGLIEGAAFLVAVQTAAACLLNAFSANRSNRYLGGLILVFLGSTKYYVFSYLGYGPVYDFLNSVSTAQFYGPVFYLFLLSVIGRENRKVALTHLALPAGLMALSFLRAYGGIWPGESYVSAITAVEYGMILFYFVLCLQLFRSGQFLPVKARQRYWLFFVLVYGYLIYNFTDLLAMIFWPAFWQSLMPGFFYFDMALYLLNFCFLILFGLTELNWMRKLVVPASVQFTGGASHPELEELGRRLDYLLEREGIHTDPELNLSVLATKLGVSGVAVSEYLKNYRKTSFYELLNYYRVQEFKRRLTDPEYQHLSLEGLAYEAGFRSKATFNRAFKKLERMTPGEFRKRVGDGEKGEA